jgi:hypothetical protein
MCHAKREAEAKNTASEKNEINTTIGLFHLMMLSYFSSQLVIAQFKPETASKP